MENKEDRKKLIDILNDDVNTMLEDIAKELQPLYDGKVAVHKATNYKNALYIAETGEVTKNLILLDVKRNYEHVILAVQKRFFDNPYYNNKLKVSRIESTEKAGDRTRDVIEIYFRTFQEKHPEVKFKKKKFTYITDK
jgi:hypothetical protein